MEDKEELLSLTSVSLSAKHFIVLTASPPSLSLSLSLFWARCGPGQSQDWSYFYHVQRPQQVLRVALTSTNLTHLDSVLHSNGDFKNYFNISSSGQGQDETGRSW